MPWTNRWLFRKLLTRADILTVLSSENLKSARELFPSSRLELVLYGINTDYIIEPPFRSFYHPIRIISLGSDEHRDWESLIAAVKNLPWCELRIASQKVDPLLYADARNISLVTPKSNDELLQLYDWADVLVLALKPNLHASGITVLQEAALRGVPMICSDIAGLRAYFSENEVTYVPPSNVNAIQQAVRVLAVDDKRRWEFVKRAQARMTSGGLDSRSYAKRHVELSKELLGRVSESRSAGC